eukprot:13836202-Heterocapsa_arctica.AAC.1
MRAAALYPHLINVIYAKPRMVAVITFPPKHTCQKVRLCTPAHAPGLPKAAPHPAQFKMIEAKPSMVAVLTAPPKHTCQMTSPFVQ